jgi:hypothetical protein
MRWPRLTGRDAPGVATAGWIGPDARIAPE